MTHGLTHITWYTDGRCVAWCACGMGTPKKPYESDARLSLQLHIDNPKEYPA